MDPISFGIAAGFLLILVIWIVYFCRRVCQGASFAHNGNEIPLRNQNEEMVEGYDAMAILPGRRYGLLKTR